LLLAAAATPSYASSMRYNYLANNSEQYIQSLYNVQVTTKIAMKQVMQNFLTLYVLFHLQFCSF